MKILSKILNNKDIINKEYADNGMSALEQRILALENDIIATKVPIGTIISYASSTAPEGYLKCEGQEVSRTTYSQLFNAIGTTYGTGDGSTTFNLPDLRGEFLRGAGTNARTNQGSGGTVGQHQDATEHIDMSVSSAAFYTTSRISGVGNGTYNKDSSIYTPYSRPYTNLTSNWSGASQASNYTSRPTNTSVLYCIKY